MLRNAYEIMNRHFLLRKDLNDGEYGRLGLITKLNQCQEYNADVLKLTDFFDGGTLLHEAISQGQHEAVFHIVNAIGCSLDVLAVRDNVGETAIQRAIRLNNEDVLREIVTSWVYHRLIAYLEEKLANREQNTFHERIANLVSVAEKWLGDPALTLKDRAEIYDLLQLTDELLDNPREVMPQYQAKLKSLIQINKPWSREMVGLVSGVIAAGVVIAGLTVGGLAALGLFGVSLAAVAGYQAIQKGQDELSAVLTSVQSQIGGAVDLGN